MASDRANEVVPSKERGVASDPAADARALEELLELQLQVSAAFDDELIREQMDLVSAEIDEDPRLASMRSDLNFVRQAVRAHLMDAAVAVPEARFEQMRIAVDRAIDAQLAVKAELASAPSWRTTVAAWWTSLRTPALLMAGASAALCVVWLSGGLSSSNPGQGGVNGGPAMASKAGHDKGEQSGGAAQGGRATPGGSVIAPTGGSQGTVVADRRVAAPTAPDVITPIGDPASNEAEIERIEFGGASGRISQIEGVRGTTTVIWIDEGDEPTVSERDL